MAHRGEGGRDRHTVRLHVANQGVLFCKDITLAILTTWQSQWTLKAPQARRSRQEKVRNFFKYCLANGMIAINPAIPDHWKSVKVKFSDQNIRALERQECEKILSSIGRHCVPTNGEQGMFRLRKRNM